MQYFGSNNPTSKKIEDSGCVYLKAVSAAASKTPNKAFDEAFAKLGFAVVFVGDNNFKNTAEEVKKVYDNTDDPRVKIIAVVVTDNFEDTVPLCGAIVLRTSLHAKKREAHEFVLPYLFEPVVGGPYKALYPAANAKPRIGFCGSPSTHPDRQKAIEMLTNNSAFTCNFVLRDKFWGGNPGDKTLINEFNDNLRDNEFCLALKWSGKF